MYRNYYIFGVLLFFILVYLLPLGVRPLMVPDETRYAEIPREMVASGNWVAPRFNGLKYYEKPIMGYWVHALSQKAFGETNFAVRLPSALATGLVAFLMFTMLSTALGRQDVRVYLAPLIFLSSFGIFGMGTIAILDNVLNFFLSSGVVLFYLASEQDRRSAIERLLLVLAGAAVGCAFMTKGFLAFVVPVITVIPYLVWQRRIKDILRMLIWPALAVVAVSLPWSVTIHLHDPDFWAYFFWQEHLHRFFSDKAHHHEPFWFFFVTMLPLFLPWMFLLPSALAGLLSCEDREHKLSRVIAFSFCWLLFPLLFFSLSNGKIVTYIIPCFPPLAILTSIGLFREKDGSDRLFTVGLSLFIVVICMLIFGVIGSQMLSLNIFSLPESVWNYDAANLRYSAGLWKPAVVTGALLFMAALSVMALRCRNREKRFLLFAFSPLLLMITTFYALPDLTVKIKAPGIFLTEQMEHIPDDAIILADSKTVGAACWYLKRNDLILINGGGELDYGLAREGGHHQRLWYADIRKLIEEKGERPIVMILQMKTWERGRAGFLEPREFISNGKYGHALVIY